MSVQDRLTVQVNHLLKDPQTHPAATPAENCEINVRVANGWAITGHYRNNNLQAITLQKTSQTVPSR